MGVEYAQISIELSAANPPTSMLTSPPTNTTGVVPPLAPDEAPPDIGSTTRVAPWVETVKRSPSTTIVDC